MVSGRKLLKKLKSFLFSKNKKGILQKTEINHSISVFCIYKEVTFLNQVQKYNSSTNDMSRYVHNLRVLTMIPCSSKIKGYKGVITYGQKRG